VQVRSVFELVGSGVGGGQVAFFSFFSFLSLCFLPLFFDSQ